MSYKTTVALRRTTKNSNDKEQGWTPTAVLHRIMEAIIVCNWCTQSPRPSGHRIVWPETWREWTDAVEDNNPADPFKPRAPVASFEQIDRMEEAMRWPVDFVMSDKARAELLQFARVRALGGSYRKVCATRQWGKSQAYLNTHSALQMIADNLKRLEVPFRMQADQQ